MSAPSRNVLFIAYYFPPMGLGGVQRTLKFVKYLPQFGWQPTVLTVTPTGYFAQDYTLLEEIHPARIRLERVGSLDPNRLFRRQGVVKMPSERWRKILTYLSDAMFIPDNKIGWRRKALAGATKLFGEIPFSAIFATAPPFTDFLIGYELHKKFHKPLVLDYRDPWLDYPLKYYPTPVHKWRNYVLEKRVLHASARIITTNRRVKETLLQRHSMLDYRDITVIPQGYDPGDLEKGLPPLPSTGKMRITHAGVFYGDRTPRFFIEALRRVLDRHPELKSQIEACFIGNIHDEHRSMIVEAGLEGNAVMTGYLDHAHCVQYLVSSDILWFMLNNDSQSPGKLYEYLGAGKTILACVPDGFIRQTLDETGGAIIVNPDDVGAIAEAIEKLYGLFRSGRLPRPQRNIVQKYNRIELTRELSNIFGFLVD